MVVFGAILECVDLKRAWRNVLGGVCLEECAWRSAILGVCLEECAWMSVLGRL